MNDEDRVAEKYLQDPDNLWFSIYGETRPSSFGDFRPPHYWASLITREGKQIDEVNFQEDKLAAECFVAKLLARVAQQN